MRRYTLLIIVLILPFAFNAKSQTTEYIFEYEGIEPNCNPFLTTKDSIKDANPFNGINDIIYVSHGSPMFAPNSHNIYTEAKLEAELNEGTNYENKSEGLFISYPFEKGDVYTVSLDRLLYEGDCGVKVIVANNLTETNDNGCETESFPNVTEDDSIVVYDVGNVTNGFFGYAEESAQFQPRKQYNNVWIASYQPAYGTGSILISNIVVYDYGKDNEPPATPSNLHASNIDTSSFELSWDEPYDNFDGVEKYKFFINGNYEGLSYSNSAIIDVDNDCETYSVQVSAVDVAGNESEMSEPISVTTHFNEPSLEIDGSSNTLCNNSTRNFTTEDYESASYLWNAGNGITLNSQYMPSTSVTGTGSYAGGSYIEVTRTFHKTCPNGNAESTVRKNFHVSQTPIQPEIHVPVEPVYGYADAMFWASSEPDDVTYEWEVYGGNIIGYADNNAEVFVEPTVCPSNPPRTPQIHLKARANNGCGTTSFTSRFVDVTCKDGPINPLSIYPNPADNQLTVAVEEEKALYGKTWNNAEKYQARADYGYYLYDLNHQLVKQYKRERNTLQINTTDLKEGFYILHVVKGDKTWKAKVEIRH